MNAIMVWTAIFATAVMTTARLVFATATFAFSVISSQTDARVKMTANAPATKVSVATIVRGAVGVNVTTAWNALGPTVSALMIANARATNLAMTAQVGTQLRTTMKETIANVTVTVAAAATTALQIANATVMCAVMTVKSATATVMIVTTVANATTAAATAMIAAKTAKTMTMMRATVRLINLLLIKFSESRSELRMHWEYDYPFRKQIRLTALESKQLRTRIKRSRSPAVFRVQ